MRMTTAQLVDQLIALGFDQSTGSDKYIRPKCSQCEALCISGTACHELGCPNARHECAGCNELVPMRQTYCQDCG